MLPDWINTDEEKIAWIENKKNLLLKLTKREFEDFVYENLKKESFSTFEKVDDWLDARLDEFHQERMAIANYYDTILSTLSDS